LYYRRKVLLALIEAFGGQLSAVECHKFMFLLCKYAKQNYYDFFPYKFGAFSVVLHQDKLRLTDLGYLASGDNFSVSGRQKFFLQIEANTQQEILSLFQQVGSLRGNSLLEKVYVDYPYYATMSTVASKILTPNAYSRVLEEHNTDESPCLFTIGYEGITIDEYLNTLIRHNIMVLADIRKNPISKKYGFSKSQLKRYVESVGITYLHFPELGVPSNMRQDLEGEKAYDDLFQFYSTEILPHQISTLNNLKSIVFEKKRIALTCFEAVYTSCHRSKVAEYFEHDPSFNVPIVHL
jgi:uncharacterized protein (DUF488 family)